MGLQSEKGQNAICEIGGILGADQIKIDIIDANDTQYMNRQYTGNDKGHFKTRIYKWDKASLYTMRTYQNMVHIATDDEVGYTQTTLLSNSEARMGWSQLLNNTQAYTLYTAARAPQDSYGNSIGVRFIE